MTERWAIPISFLPQESTYSWLIRTALAHGCDPLALTGFLWPDWRAWTTDLDREISEDRLSALTRYSGIPIKRFQQSFLISDVSLITGMPPPKHGTWPWILALGTRNRTYRGGLQICPKCLSDDEYPYFRRHWRFAWHTACYRHSIRLIDRCPSCDSPIEPHRLEAHNGHLVSCVRCQFDYRNIECQPHNKHALDFQNLADQVLKHRQAIYWNQLVLGHDWFALCRFIIALTRRVLRRPLSKLTAVLKDFGIDVYEPNVSLFSHQLEMLSVTNRERLMAATFKFLNINPDQLLQSLDAAGVSQNSLTEWKVSIPPTLHFLTQLDICHRSRRSIEIHTKVPRSKRAVLIAWHRVRRNTRS
ncbi:MULTISPECIES: TniQ family protein [Gynuella]|uniref:TniQ domain-containing protein n=1 Tax=Gynuella sunshinyii YC6258 TaxID=1445510 RepID=A0A0C5VPV0_9GAMM|nr:hypothetical Protein YC6258_00227 [Gynuella sunshinyii YC6258]